MNSNRSYIFLLHYFLLFWSKLQVHFQNHDYRRIYDSTFPNPCFSKCHYFEIFFWVYFKTRKKKKTITRSNILVDPLISPFFNVIISLLMFEIFVGVPNSRWSRHRTREDWNKTPDTAETNKFRDRSGRIEFTRREAGSQFPPKWGEHENLKSKSGTNYTPV